MKKIIIIITVIALVVCLALARLADHGTAVPPSPSGNASDMTDPSPSTNTPGDIENGLGWG